MTPFSETAFVPSRFRALVLAAAATLLAAAGAELATTTSCAPTPTNNPLRSFEDARNVDVVCMQVLASEDGGGIPPVPLPQAACTPVPVGVTGSLLPNHLFALVTQVKRGEVAVVDLTAGALVNEDFGSPGINFLTVGQLPTGIASSPDGQMSYVSAAELNKPAIYALPSTKILGNSQQLEAGPQGQRSPTPTVLTTWPACALPQSPESITIIPSPPPEPPVDGGPPADAGDVTGQSPAGYVLSVVLAPSSAGLGAGSVAPSRVVTIDPLPLLRGANIAVDGGAGDSGVDPPGQLVPCKILGELPLSGGAADAGLGPPWPDGVKWLDAGVDAPTPTSATCTPGGPDASGTPQLLAPPAPQPTSVARADQFLYVGDGALPLIHVLDMTEPAHPKELAPLRATSLVQPSRSITIGAIAISPTTRDYHRYLYAVDATDSPASIIVYDVTDPVHGTRLPMRRPHSSLVPLQPEDRIQFAAGVSALAFVQHDWPLAQTVGGSLLAGAAQTGLLCNPNPNVDLFAADAAADAQAFSDFGAYYRYSSLAFADEPLGPQRLRGIFAFATLSSGDVVTIDVDDWDAPCRRPQTMGPSDAGDGARTNGYTSAIAPPEPDIGDHDGGPLDPYEAPYTGITNGVTWVTDEVFFPVSAPNRPRSSFPLSNDPTLGLHYPYLVSTPLLYSAGPDGGLGAEINGSIAAGNPVLLPTTTPYPDPAALPDGGIGVRIAYEDPTAEIDQAWTIDYEGKLVSFNGNLPGTIDVAEGELPLLGLAAQDPPYWTLFISNPGGLLCSKGVEDWEVGQQRAQQFITRTTQVGLPPPKDMLGWVGDYIQVADDLLPQTDPYWSAPPQASQGPSCWGPGFGGPGTASLDDPTDRYNTCMAIFGLSSAESIARDFPIVQAFDDGLVVTRFNYPVSTTNKPVTPSTSNREITVPDPTNVAALMQLKCCFHGQMNYNVRTGGEWVTTGSASGYLHHVTVDPKTSRCVTSCDPEDALLNARTLGIAATSEPPPGGTKTYSPDRDSPLATRNPTFAFFIQHPWGADPNISPETVFDGGTPPQVVTRPARDDVWQFALKGQIAPLAVNLAATNTSVSPQSMLFIPSLGQLAVVDGSQEGQGLILIDLNTVSISGNTYY